MKAKMYSGIIKPVHPELKGVKGWLLLFVIILILIRPLNDFYYLFSYWNDTSELYDEFPELLLLFYISLPLVSVSSFYSIRAGIALIRINPRAVRMAKNFLFIYVVVMEVIPVFAIYNVGLPSEMLDASSSEINYGIGQTIFFFIVWYWYLSVSKRVKATYPKPPKPINKQSEYI